MIYALFKNGTNFCAALFQGAAADDGSGGQFDEVGDERWIKNTQAMARACKCNNDDWVEISDEDLQKYMLGRSGGDNGTGYIRDPETNHAVSAPAVVYSFDEKIALIQTKYNKRLEELKESYTELSLAGINADIIKEQYATLVEESNAEFIQVIENAN